MTAIYKRELRAYFTSPIGYVFVGIFLAIIGYFFTAICLFGGTADFRYVLANCLTVFLFLIPILTMRLLSEEKNLKTDQLLLTAPVSIPQIVFGKFFAAATVYVLTLALTLLYMPVLAFYGTPAWGEILGSYIGFLLLGLSFIAIGIFISGLTENQMIAAVASFGILLLLYVVNWAAQFVSGGVMKFLVTWLSVTRWYTDFVMGVFSLSSVVYYISIIALFLFFTMRLLERKRWN